MSTHHPSPGPSTQSLPPRQKQKPHTVGIGIAAGAEDAKYQAKYRDLKRKVKEIETENDTLHFKVLQAKRNIQRMKLERAILYERLSAAPHASEGFDRHIVPPNHGGPAVPDPHPSSRSHSGAYQPQDIHEHHRMDSARAMSDYTVPHDRQRMTSSHDGRPIGPMGVGVALSPHLSGRRASPPRHPHNEGYDPAHHISQMPPLPPVPQVDAARGHGHSRAHMSPTLHHSHSNSSQHRARSPSSHSRSRHSSSQAYIPGHPQPPISSGAHVIHGSPVLERERSRRHDAHEYPNLHRDPHGNGRHSVYTSHHSPPLHPSEIRPSRSVHGHQRMAPAPYLTRDEHYEQPRDLERVRDWDHEREISEHERTREMGRAREMSGSHAVSPPMVHRPRQAMERGDYVEHHVRARDEMYYRDPSAAAGSYAVHSRSGTPASGSGSGAGEGASLPESRSHYYDPERPRSFKLRPVTQPNEDIDFEDNRSVRDRGAGGDYSLQDPSRLSLESRKRGRNDMDIDSDDLEDGPVHTAGRGAEDRSSKRYHREQRANAEKQEDVRMGHS